MKQQQDQCQNYERIDTDDSIEESVLNEINNAALQLLKAYCHKYHILTLLSKEDCKPSDNVSNNKVPFQIDKIVKQCQLMTKQPLKSSQTSKSKSEKLSKYIFETNLQTIQQLHQIRKQNINKINHTHLRKLQTRKLSSQAVDVSKISEARDSKHSKSFEQLCKLASINKDNNHQQSSIYGQNKVNVLRNFSYQEYQLQHEPDDKFIQNGFLQLKQQIPTFLSLNIIQSSNNNKKLNQQTLKSQKINAKKTYSQQQYRSLIPKEVTIQSFLLQKPPQTNNNHQFYTERTNQDKVHYVSKNDGSVKSQEHSVSQKNKINTKLQEGGVAQRFLSLQRSKIQSQKNNAVSLHKQVNKTLQHAIPNQVKTHLESILSMQKIINKKDQLVSTRDRNNSQQFSVTQLITNDFEQHRFLKTIQCLLKQICELKSLSEVYKFVLQNKSHEILSTMQIDPQSITMNQLQQSITKQMKKFKFININVVLTKLSTKNSNMSFIEFGTALTSDIVAHEFEQLKPKSMQRYGTKVNLVLPKLFSAWSELSYFETILKNHIKTSKQHFENLISRICGDNKHISIKDSCTFIYGDSRSRIQCKKVRMFMIEKAPELQVVQFRNWVFR